MTCGPPRAIQHDEAKVCVAEQLCITMLLLLNPIQLLRHQLVFKFQQKRDDSKTDPSTSLMLILRASVLCKNGYTHSL